MFGPLSVQTSSSVLQNQAFGGVKPKELLALLLLARGRPVTKEALAVDLWPSQGPKNTDGTLETYVSQLRKRLCPDRATARRLLVTDSGAYRFDTTQASVDVDLFDDLVLRSERAGSDRVQLLTQAAALARAGQLLSDLGDAPWLVSERELYCDRATRVHVLAAEGLLLQSAFASALQHAEEALHIRRYSEEAFRLVMLANYAMGHTDAAHRAFSRCREILGEELGQDPTSPTESLAADIDAGAPLNELIQNWDDRATTITVGSDAADRRDPTRQLPFIGREREIDTIVSHVEQSRSGNLRMVLLGGPVGIGRTTLLDHLYSVLPGRIGRETYLPTDRDHPPLPLARALDDALAGGPGALAAERYSNAPYLTGGTDVFHELSDLLRLAGPIAILLDDFQWADGNTIAALGWLRRYASSLPVTIILSVKQPLKRSDDLSAIGIDHEIPVRAIDRTDAAASYGIDPELIEATGGVPLMLADAWRWACAGGSGVSPSLRTSILQSTRGLGGLHAAVLQASCQVDEPFNPFDLEAHSPVRASDAIDALDELCQIGYLRRDHGCFRFQAPVVREVISSTLADTPNPTN